MKGKLRILIADDHPAVRAGMTVLLKGAGLSVVGEAVDGGDALAKTVKLKPDVVLLDVRMPKKDGLWALEKIRKKIPGQRIIMLSAYDDKAFLVRSIRLGADDYILKDTPIAVIVDTIKQIHNGEPRSESSILARIRRVNMHRVRDANNPLTDREMEILRYISMGQSNIEIGTALEIDVETVKEHVANLLRKLDVADRTQAAVWAVRNGHV